MIWIQQRQPKGQCSKRSFYQPGQQVRVSDRENGFKGGSAGKKRAAVQARANLLCVKRRSRGKEKERSRREQKIAVNQLLPSCHHSDGRWERLWEGGASKNEFSTKWCSTEKTEEKATHFRKLKKMQHFVRFQIGWKSHSFRACACG